MQILLIKNYKEKKFTMKKLKLISLILSLTAILSSHSLAEKEPNSNENIVPYYMQNANQHIHQNPNDNRNANQLNFLNQNNNQGANQNNNQNVYLV